MSPAWRNYGVFVWIQSCLTWISGWILLPAVSLIIVLFSSTCCPSWDDLVKLIATLIKYNFVVFCVNFSVCCFTDMTLGTCISDCAIAPNDGYIEHLIFIMCHHALACRARYCFHSLVCPSDSLPVHLPMMWYCISTNAYIVKKISAIW